MSPDLLSHRSVNFPSTLYILLYLHSYHTCSRQSLHQLLPCLSSPLTFALSSPSIQTTEAGPYAALASLSLPPTESCGLARLTPLLCCPSFHFILGSSLPISLVSKKSLSRTQSLPIYSYQMKRYSILSVS